MSTDKIISLLTDKPRLMLLIDASGAFITAFMLGIVLANNTKVFGMPKEILEPLAIIALCFAIYSFCGYLFARKYKMYIRIIALANLSYCVTSATLIFMNIHSLTSFGILYFIGEIILITIIAFIEWQVAKNNN